MTENEFQVMHELFVRYQHLIAEHAHKLTDMPDKCGYSHLYTLCNQAIVFGRDYPFDKMSRWLGFVQGVLASKGIISVDEERDYTRPLFHKLYGTEVPSFGG